MNSAKPSGQGKDRNTAAPGDPAGARKVVRFFSVEGQRRRLEFAKMPPARAMTPEEEVRYLGELQAQEKAAQEKAAARERAAQEKAAREKAARSRTAAAARGKHDSHHPEESADPVGRNGATSRSRTARGRSAMEAAEEWDGIATGRRSGGRRATQASVEAPAEPTSAAISPAAEPSVGTSSPRRGQGRTRAVSRRGVIGAPASRED